MCLSSARTYKFMYGGTNGYRFLQNVCAARALARTLSIHANVRVCHYRVHRQPCITTQGIIIRMHARTAHGARCGPHFAFCIFALLSLRRAYAAPVLRPPGPALWNSLFSRFDTMGGCLCVSARRTRSADFCGRLSHRAPHLFIQIVCEKYSQVVCVCAVCAQRP